MTEADLARIEAELQIRLPDAYRKAMVPFPLPAFAGNDHSPMWDNADRLIAYNRELRQGLPGGVKPWPVHFFALGDDGDGSPCAIDLRSPEAAVWWMDRGHTDISSVTCPTFAEWAEERLDEMRTELIELGVEENAAPADLARARDAIARADARFMWTLIAVAAVIILGIVGLGLWLRQ